MQREKVLLVRAPNLYKSEQWKKQGVLRTPTNLALLASYIRECGRYDPEILDFELEDSTTPQEVAISIVAKKAKIIGFTTLTPRFPTILKITQEIKKISKDLVTIVGGPHITGRPQDCQYISIDYGVTGEGEPAILDLLNALTSSGNVSNVPNIVHKLFGKLIINPKRHFIRDLDSLPFPAWDLLDMKQYKDPPFFQEKSHAGVFTSRGCPYDCTFCASKVTWERKVRYRSIDNVIAELTELKSAFGTSNIYFYDDHIATKRDRATDLLERVKNLGIKYQLQLRADSVTPKLALLLKQSGCLSAAIGVEAGDEFMLKSIRKRETKNQIRKAVRTLREAEVPTLTSYIIGLPGDTHETIQKTLDFARELNTDQMKFMLLTPVPGTEVYQMAVERGLLNPDDLEQMEKSTFYDTTAINLSNVSTEDLIRYQDIAYTELEKRS